MNFAFVKKAAPFMAAVAESAFPVATPFLGIASKLLSNGLGVKVDPTSDGIGKVLETAMSSAEGIAKLKELDNTFAEHMKQLDIQSVEDWEKIASEDRASARTMQEQTRSRLPGILAVFVTIGFFGLLLVIAFHQMPAGSEKIFDVMTGSLGTAWIMVISFYFGSSAGSERKTEIMSGLEKRKA